MNQTTAQYQLNFVVFSPPFRANVGGVIALYNLARIIDEFGFACKVFDMYGLRLSNNIFEKYATEADVNENTIVVYPEVIFGNPLNAKYVVRWILCELGIHCPHDIYKTWGKDDFVYHYGTYNTEKDVKNYNILAPLYLDSVFKNHGKSRNGYCHIIRKGHKFHKPLKYLHPPESLFLDDDLSQEILSEIFNIKEYLISYDPYSYNNFFAALCGCIPIIIPIAGTTKKEWLKSSSLSIILEQFGEHELKGIAYGIEEIEYARNTLEGARYQQDISIQYGTVTVHRFLNDIISIACANFELKILPNNSKILRVADVFPISTSQCIPSNNIQYILDLCSVTYPAIESVGQNTDRLLWTVMIPTYNPNLEYLEKTLRSILEQDLGVDQMQIEVIDDRSTQNDPEELVRKVGQGRVSFYRQPKNLGLIGNWNACIDRARGHLVHILHQDDVVKPGFYSRLQAAFEQEPTIGAAFCRYFYMDEKGCERDLSLLERETPGVIPNWIERIAVTQRIECPSIVVKREVYEKLGGYCSEAHYAADWEMWKRIAAHYSVWYEPELLASYRSHSSSESSRLIKSGANTADTLKAIEISQAYLPVTIAAELSYQARENCAFKALNIARGMLSKGDIDAASAQIREGIKSSQSSNTLVSVLELVQEIVRDSYQYNLLPIDALTLFLSAFQEAFQKQEAIALIENLKLRETNFIIFPDWSQPEDLLYQDLASVMTSLMNHPDINQTTLLLDRGNLTEDEATLFVSGVVMNLVMEEGLDVADELEISLVGQLSEMQWEVLSSRINARIVLEHENQQAIAQNKIEKIPTYEIPSFNELTSVLT